MRMRFVFVLSLFFLVVVGGHAQKIMQFTPYDDLPGIPKMDKPQYYEQMPEFAKMLYRYPVNFKEISEAFEEYERDHPAEESPEARYFINWSRVVADYVRDDGTIVIPDTKELFEKMKEMQLKAYNPEKKSSNADDPSDWTFLGPKKTYWMSKGTAAPWQVNVYSFDVCKSQPEVLYCGTETGFVNKTTDGGLTWKMVGEDYYFGGSVTAVAVDPVDPGIAYVAAGNQIHKTTDGGVTWKPLLSSPFHAVRLKIAPDHPERLAAAGDKGVLLSYDSGATWVLKVNEQTYDVEFQPGASDTIFAVGVHPSLKYYHIWRSGNKGADWRVIKSFSQTLNQSGALLAMTPANPNVLYIALLAHGHADVGNTDPDDSYPFIYKATYQNGSWSFNLQKIGEPSSAGLGGFTIGQGYFDFVLEVSPDDENELFFGTCNLWRSEDGGVTFKKVGGYGGYIAIHPDIQDIQLMSDGKGWVSTDGGMTYTRYHFKYDHSNYFRINGIVGSQFWGWDQGWNEDLIVGGRYHNGNTAISELYGDVALRLGGAESPTGWVLKGKSRHAAFDDLGGGKILPKTYDQPFEGTFVFSKFPNMDQYGGLRGNLVQHPNYYNIVYVGEGNALWVSRDFGESFDLLYQFPDRVRYFDISYKNPSVFYVDVVNHGLYRSDNGGESWVLTSLPSSWAGRTFIVISPYDEKTVYACYKNGAWSTSIGEIYRSTDGGANWEDWTGSLNVYMKGLAIQPTSSGKDLIYVFTKAKNDQPGTCWYRKVGMDDWAPFNNNYPDNYTVNMGLPFFRDGKLRVGGSGGVWESPLAEPDFAPVVNFWVQAPVSTACANDTLIFDDHSMLNHDGASWHWEITPAPRWTSDPDQRRFKVLPDTAGNVAYTVTLTVTKNGQSYSRTIQNMVYVTTCPSVNDCDNPGMVPKNNWSVIYVDSEEPSVGATADKAIDGNESTHWHTQWVSASPPHPHEIQVDMADTFKVFEFTYLPRQDGGLNGTIKDYELYLSDSLGGDNKPVWGDAVSKGAWEKSAAPKTVVFPSPVRARYFRLVALSEVNDNPWTSAAELSVKGCYWTPSEPPTTVRLPSVTEIKAFPVPAGQLLHVPLPAGDRLTWKVYSVCGALVDQGVVDAGEATWNYDVSALQPGTYIMQLEGSDRTAYRVKFVKMK